MVSGYFLDCISFLKSDIMSSFLLLLPCSPGGNTNPWGVGRAAPEPGDTFLEGNYLFPGSDRPRPGISA